MKNMEYCKFTTQRIQGLICWYLQNNWSDRQTGPQTYIHNDQTYYNTCLISTASVVKNAVASLREIFFEVFKIFRYFKAHFISLRYNNIHAGRIQGIVESTCQPLMRIWRRESTNFHYIFKLHITFLLGLYLFHVARQYTKVMRWIRRHPW